MPMKKETIRAGKLILKKMIIAGLNTTDQSRILGGSVLQQPTQTVQASEANCATMSDDCPGPQVLPQQPPLL